MVCCCRINFGLDEFYLKCINCVKGDLLTIIYKRAVFINKEFLDCNKSNLCPSNLINLHILPNITSSVQELIQIA